MILSIITPCLNRAELVAEAVESVRRQDYPDVEHIIMDGGSTDGTLRILSHYPHLQVYSQPDKGIYDALNSGVRLAHGDVIGFLNTDDLYEPDIFGAVARAFAESPQIDALVGGASIFSGDALGKRTTRREFPCVPRGDLLTRATLGAPIFNAWFFRPRLLSQLGGFNTRYRYAADRDLLIRMALQDLRYESIDRPFYHYRMHPGSYTLSGRESGEDEYMFETRVLAEDYLKSGRLWSRERKCFKAWHTQIMMEQIITAVHKKAVRRAIGYVFIGLRYDFGLSVQLVREFIRRSSGMLLGGSDH